MRLLVDHHLSESVVVECVKHFVGAEVGNTSLETTSLETFDRFRYKKKRIYVNLVVRSVKKVQNI